MKVNRVALTLLVVGLAVFVGPRVADLIRLMGFGSETKGKRRELETVMTVTMLRTAIDLFEADCKKLPPMTMSELTSDPRWSGLSMVGNTTNECNECLVVALRHPDLTRPLGELPGRNPFGNTDGDAWNKVPVGCDSADATEFLDAYGNPIAYITAARYGQTLRVVRGDGKTVEVRAVKRPNGGFYNPDAFQLISLGRDEMQDEGERLDDIENFTREPE